MVFIEAKRDPNSTLKMLSQKVEERSKSEEKNAFKKPENREPHEIAPHPTRPSLARPCQVARSCHPVRPGHARSWVHGPCVQFPPVCCLFSRVFCLVFLRFGLLGARGVLHPLLFLELTFEVLFSTKTRRFLLK